MRLRLASLGVAGLVLAFLLLSLPNLAAYPGSVRWGYGNCSSCHFNVAGGGILTPYGRQLSRELLSTWGGRREAEFAYGSTGLPPWLALGGDVEFVVTNRTQGDAIRLMQADLEGALTRGRLLAVAAVGRRGSGAGMAGNGWLSRRHYLQLSLTPALSLRAGRFLPNYGVWNGDASTATHKGLGWDRDSYNVEGNWIGERFNVAVTGIVAGTGGDAQKGVSLSGGIFFAGRHKVWLSYVSRGNASSHREAGGLSGVFGIGPRAYLLLQTDLQRIRSELETPVASRELHVNACFARETLKGLYVLVLNEVTRRDLGTPGRLSYTYGAGLRWFPRPHLELQLRWRQRDREAESPEYLDGLSAFVHFYP